MLLLLLACDNAPQSGNLEGYTTGELRTHRTAYCGGILRVEAVIPATITAVWFCDSEDLDARCELKPEASIIEDDGILQIVCPAEYDDSGIAKIRYLSVE